MENSIKNTNSTEFIKALIHQCDDYIGRQKDIACDPNLDIETFKEISTKVYIALAFKTGMPKALKTIIPTDAEFINNSFEAIVEAEYLTEFPEYDDKYLYDMYLDMFEGFMEDMDYYGE